MPGTFQKTPLNRCFDARISTMVTLDVNLMDSFVSDVQREHPATLGRGSILGIICALI